MHKTPLVLRGKPGNKAKLCMESNLLARAVHFPISQMSFEQYLYIVNGCISKTKHVLAKHGI